MTDLLFVYGSLMPSLAGDFGAGERAQLAAESTLVGRASLAAELYDLGAYPGLKLVEGLAAGVAVHGDLLRLNSPGATFAWLDPFEDIEPGRNPAAALYERLILPVLSNNAASKAWVYALRRVPPGALKVASGRWHAPSP